MPKYIMLDHGGVLDDRMVPANEVTDNDIVLGKLDDDNIRILKNGVQIVRTLNILVDHYGYQIVYHSSNDSVDQLRIHSQLVQGARAKGLVFPAIAAAAAPDRALADKHPENPSIGFLGETNIPFLSYAYANSKSGKSCVRAALATYLAIPKDERGMHIVLDDGSTNIESAREEGYRAYLINEKGSLDAILNDILYEERMANPLGLQAEERYAEAETAHENRKNRKRTVKAAAAGGFVGCVASAVYIKAATASGATLLGGMSATLFIAACTIVGAGLLLLAAYLFNRYKAGRLGFFQPRPAEIRVPEHQSLLIPTRS